MAHQQYCSTGAATITYHSMLLPHRQAGNPSIMKAGLLLALLLAVSAANGELKRAVLLPSENKESFWVNSCTLLVFVALAV